MELQKTRISKGKALLALTALSAVLISCASQTSLEKSTLNSSKELLFVGHDDGDLDIYTTSTLSGKVSKLTDNDRDDMHPAWSKNGKYIVYASSEHGLYEIYIMDADGSNKRRITNNQSMDLMPQWAPDGASLVYVSDRDGTEQIYQYHLESKNETALTSGGAGSIQPVYSNDGRHIAYLQRDGKKLYLKAMNADGGDKKMLVDKLSIITMSWSPDSSKIAFSGRNKRLNSLYSVELESGQLHQLTESKGSDTNPVWLPDGESLIFLSAENLRERAQLYRLNLDGNADPIRLSQSGLEEMNIAVSPQGNQVSYVRYENRFFHAYMMNLDDGKTEKMATELDRAQLTPSFRP